MRAARLWMRVLGQLWRGSEGQEGFGEGHQAGGAVPRAFLDQTGIFQKKKRYSTPQIGAGCDLILQMRKMRCREGKGLGQGHSQERQGLPPPSPATPDPRPGITPSEPSLVGQANPSPQQLGLQDRPPISPQSGHLMGPAPRPPTDFTPIKGAAFPPSLGASPAASTARSTAGSPPTCSPPFPVHDNYQTLRAH